MSEKHPRDRKRLSMTQYLIETSVIYFSTETTFPHVLLSDSRQFAMQSNNNFPG